jgi:hypothetical protein
MQELLEARNHWTTQPDTPERELALKDISDSLRILNEGALTPPEAA